MFMCMAPCVIASTMCIYMYIHTCRLEDAFYKKSLQYYSNQINKIKSHKVKGPCIEGYGSCCHCCRDTSDLLVSTYYKPVPASRH